MTKTPKELTNDWKDGKLERGWYYVKSGDEVYPDYFNGYFIQTGDKYGIEVLSPIPSYDHFIELTEKIKTLSSENERLLNLQAVKNKKIEELESDSLAKKEGEEIVAELTNENNNLRGLLRECKPYLSYKINKDKHVGFTPNAANLLTRINAALNETQANTAADIKIQNKVIR